MPFLYIFFLVSAALGPGVSYRYIYLFHIVLFFLIIDIAKHIILRRISKNYSPSCKVKSIPTKLHYFFYIMLFWYSISLIWCINIVYGMQYVLYIIFGLSIVLFFVYYANSIDRQMRCIRCFTFVFIIEIIIAFLEIHTSFRFPISPFSPYATNFGREMGIGNYPNEDFLNYLYSMPTGFQWNPNNLAITMVIILPFFLFVKYRIIKITFCLLIFWIILQCGSRLNMVAFFVSLFLYLFFFKVTRAFYGVIIVILIILFFMFLPVYSFVPLYTQTKLVEMKLIPQVITTFLFDDGCSVDNSIGIRRVLIQNGFDALRNTNGLGVGGGCSKQIQENYSGSDFHIKSMHNFWIEIAVEGGIYFGVVFIIWYIYILICLFNIGHKLTDSNLKYCSQSLFVSMSSFIISAISASSVIYLLPMWIMYGLSIATINNYIRIFSGKTFSNNS